MVLPAIFRPMSTLLSPFPDVHTLQHELSCKDKEMKVSLDSCQLRGLGFGNEISVYLQDHNCSYVLQQEEGNWMSVTIPTQATACGNLLQVSLHSHTSCYLNVGLRLMGPNSVVTWLWASCSASLGTDRYVRIPKWCMMATFRNPVQVWCLSSRRVCCD